jgi:hypothetical protein
MYMVALLVGRHRITRHVLELFQACKWVMYDDGVSNSYHALPMVKE